MSSLGFVARAHRARPYRIASPETAKAILNSWQLPSRQDISILELYPDTGCLTQAALDLPNVKRVVAMTPTPEMAAVVRHQERLTVFPQDPYHWEHWSMLKASNCLAHVKRLPWTEEQNSLFLAGTFADNIISEKFVIQLLHMMVSRIGIWSYGRSEFGCVTSRSFFERMSAAIGSANRHRTALLLSTLCDFEETWNASSNASGIVRQSLRQPQRQGKDVTKEIAVFKITPKKNMLIKNEEEFEALDFLGRHLFGHRSTVIGKSIKYIAPNAEILLNRCKNGRSIANTKPSDLQLEYWLQLVSALLEWEFRPRHMMEINVQDSDLELL